MSRLARWVELLPDDLRAKYFAADTAFARSEILESFAADYARGARPIERKTAELDRGWAEYDRDLPPDAPNANRRFERMLEGALANFEEKLTAAERAAWKLHLAGQGLLPDRVAFMTCLLVKYDRAGLARLQAPLFPLQMILQTASEDLKACESLNDKLPKGVEKSEDRKELARLCVEVYTLPRPRGVPELGGKALRPKFKGEKNRQMSIDLVALELQVKVLDYYARNRDKIPGFERDRIEALLAPPKPSK
ncbi:MAG TPA: hypothetical protein VNC50_08055, partial [Planctomycetia bacterium]|nr:hypothetical protein [Planctomycetia bacterium]